MFYAKKHYTKGEIVVAICDEELLGKWIKGKDVKIYVDKKFYGDKVIDERIAIEMLKEATIANLLGRKIVELAVSNGFIEKKFIMLIGDVPHAQLVKI